MINMKVVYCCIKPLKVNKGKAGINKLLIPKEHPKNSHMARVARKTGKHENYFCNYNREMLNPR